MSPLLLLLAAGSVSYAADDNLGWDTHGELREILTNATPFAIDSHGGTLDQKARIDNRIRAGVFYKGDLNHFDFEVDLFDGQIAGDLWNIERSGDERNRDEYGAVTLDGFQPRKLSYGGYVGDVQLEFGLMTSHWGLGLLANDGDHEPLFGREDFGDRVIRFKVTTAPFKNRVGAAAPTFIMVGLDTVYADDLAILTQGQLANQLVLAVLHDKGDDDTKFGVYGVFRNQFEEGFDRSTQVGVIDAYASHPIALSDTLTLTVAGEAAAIMGYTSRSQSYNGQKGLDVRSGAFAGQLKLASKMIDVHLNFGASTGDGQPDDSVTTDFTADRDFAVGMTLFDEVMGGIDAGTHSILTDPQWSGQAPDGVELVANEGAWRRSAYLQPAVSIRPIGQVELRLGAVFATATAPVAHPFYSFRNGGVPTNHLNESTDDMRGLGTELNWAIRVQPLSTEDMAQWRLRPRLEVQGGHAFLGDALGGGTVSVVQTSLRIEW